MIIGCVGVGLLLLGYIQTGGTLDGASDYLGAYMRNGGGWVALLGLTMMVVGFLVMRRPRQSREPQETPPAIPTNR